MSTTHLSDVTFLFSHFMTGLIGYHQCNMTWEWNGRPAKTPGGGGLTWLYGSAGRNVQYWHHISTAYHHRVWSVWSLLYELIYLFIRFTHFSHHLYSTYFLYVPVGSCEQQDFVGVKRLPLHQKGHVWHIFIVQEVRIWNTQGQKNLMFFWVS